jgi:anaerobic magnesium-protoporphyrin IX monomethyl ester cyclase
VENKVIYPRRLSDIWYLDNNGSIVLFYDKKLLIDKYVLNEIGSFIWKNCDGDISNYQIAQKLHDVVAEENIKIEKVERDVNEFLNDLKSKELLDWENDDNIDVLLIVPPFPELYSPLALKSPEYSAPPLGLAYIAAVLINNNYKVEIYDMHINALMVEDVIKKYKNAKPKIVGITSTTPTYPNAIRIAKLLKAYDENIVIVVGGIHVTCLPEDAMKLNCFDYIVIGEGEYSMLDIVNYHLKGKGEIKKISGLVYKDEFGKYIYNKKNKVDKNLDKLPFPARQLLELDLYYQKGSIISSRGCVYNCTYCSCPSITEKIYRMHSVDYVLNEIQYMQKIYNIKYFDFHDDTFNLKHERIDEFVKKIKERKLSFSWGCFCSVKNFTYELAKEMKASGCDVIQFGVESGNQEVLNKIKKNITIKEIEDAVKSAKKAKIKKISCGFIIGHSCDTEKTINETIKFGKRLSSLGATRLSISILTPYPGTEEYARMNENGLKILIEDWSQYIFSKVVMETKYLKKEKIRELYAKAVDQFLNVIEY